MTTLTECRMRHFWWPTVNKDTQEFVSSCPTCARSKSSHQTPAGLLQPLPIPSRPWSHIALDFVTGLPPSLPGNIPLWAQFGRAEVDLFASQRNSHCAMWFSMALSDDPPLGVDAFAQWQSKLLYAFPPRCLILPLLGRVRRERLSIVLVAPDRVGAPWYSEMTQMKVGQPWAVPQFWWAMPQEAGTRERWCIVSPYRAEGSGRPAPGPATDPVPPELIKLLQKSENSLLHHIFTDKETEIPTSKGLSKVTVVSKFKNSLESLMRILHTTTPHYTRCIKPNPDCKPLTFKKEEVIMQLEACGIVETIHISAAGFPIRIPFKGFMQRYGLIAKYSHVKSGIHSVDAGADYILRRGVENLLSVVSQHEAFDPLCKDNSGKHNSWVHCGRTKVFLTQLMLDFLEYQRKKVLCQCAFSIQCCWLRYQRRRRCARLLSATRIQAVVRSWLVRRQLQRWNRAAAVIQNTWRMWRVRFEKNTYHILCFLVPS
ncbi:unconventional myosin-XIX-like, partial [Notothenia coriiceps]|uniref:Unconventional myosin-XIX-like n=1 Tax=Notothenia coriiceps TaxID=8208 RepID=A0A6I9Q280_9TELE